MRVLVVEDEKRLAAGLKKGLEAEGFAADVALNGTDGLWMARENPYDAIVLDILLPGMNGYKVCATLREEGIWTPILMLTAKDGEYDEAEALDTGADDFLSKPFSFVVLLARLRALFRRGAPPQACRSSRTAGWRSGPDPTGPRDRAARSRGRGRPTPPRGTRGRSCRLAPSRTQGFRSSRSLPQDRRLGLLHRGRPGRSLSGTNPDVRRANPSTSVSYGSAEPRLKPRLRVR